MCVQGSAERMVRNKGYTLGRGENDCSRKKQCLIGFFRTSIQALSPVGAS